MRKLFAALVGLILWPAAAAAAPSVGLYYYPWYGTFGGGHSFDDTLRDHLVPEQSPALRHYSSRDAAVIASHIDQSHRANVDFWALSWWGPTSAEDTTIRNSILANPRAGELQYAIHYESAGRFGSMDNPNFDKMLPDFRHLAQNYFGNPNYLRIDGKPVVFLYVTRAYFNTQASRDAVANVRQAIHNEFGYDMYLVGDDFFTTDVVEQRAKLWDAITNFDAYGSVLASGGSTQAALNTLTSYYNNARTKAHTWGVDFIPTASPGFNDRGVREGHTAAPRYMEDAPTVVEGSLFRKMLTDVVVPRTDAATGDILMINSFNEWHEDTQIEPTNVAAADRRGRLGHAALHRGPPLPGLRQPVSRHSLPDDGDARRRESRRPGGRRGRFDRRGSLAAARRGDLGQTAISTATTK